MNRVLQNDCSFKMKKENFELALKALKDFADFEENELEASDRLTLPELYGDNDNLADMFKHFGWEPLFNKKGDIHHLVLEPDKLNDDMLVFFAILAPFVDSGSYIEMTGEEEGNIWRWTFRDGKFYEQEAFVLILFRSEDTREINVQGLRKSHRQLRELSSSLARKAKSFKDF